MQRSESKSWKKVFEKDIPYVIGEFKESIERPAVIIVDGDLGAGKTTFIREFNPSSNVTSPTYSLVNESGEIAMWIYCLETPDELDELDLDVYGEQKDYFFIEWGRKYLSDIKKTLGEEFNYYDLEIKINDSNQPQSQNIPSRNYVLSKYG